MSRHTPLLIALLFVAACTANPYLDGSKPHRAAQGFRNVYPHPENAGFWKWKWEQSRRPAEETRRWLSLRDRAARHCLSAGEPARHHRDLDRPRHGPFPDGRGQRAHRSAIFRACLPRAVRGPQTRGPGDPGPGRSSPHRCGPDLARPLRPPRCRKRGRARPAARGGSPRFFAGLDSKAWFAALGITVVVEMDWWERVEFRGLDLHFVPVQHWSKRTLTDENQRLWGGWVVRQPAFSFYFAGDTGYSMDFADVGRRFGGFDLAAIPVGGYEPRWFMQIMHVNPAESVRIHRDVKSRASLGIHWGTFDDLTDEGLYEPPKVLADEARKAGLAEGAFFVLKHGETRRIRPQERRARSNLHF